MFCFLCLFYNNIATISITGSGAVKDLSISDLRQSTFIMSLIIIHILMQRLFPNVCQNVDCTVDLNSSIACVTNTIFLFSDCQAISIQNAVVKPDSTVNSGSAVHVNCKSGYTMDSSGRNNTTLTCTDGKYDDVTPTCSAGSYFLSFQRKQFYFLYRINPKISDTFSFTNTFLYRINPKISDTFSFTNTSPNC